MYIIPFSSASETQYIYTIRVYEGTLYKTYIHDIMHSKVEKLLFD